MINPVLKILKEGDVVLMKVESSAQIVKLTSTKYHPEDEEYPNRNWLDFEGDVLYTTERVHKEDENFIMFNCMAISEILNDFLIEKYVKDFNMFSPKEHQLSDEELELKIIKYENLLRN